MKNQHYWLLSAAFIVSIGGVLAFFRKPAMEQSFPLLQAELIELPADVHTVASEEQAELPYTVSLNVPFTSQAPHENWVMPYKEACEEASIVMALAYAHSERIASREEAGKKILALVEKNTEQFGDSVDESIQEVQDLMNEIDSSVSTGMIDDPSVYAMKTELSLGNVLVAPVIGKELMNPYFRPEVPYHMLVITGYDAEGNFITNEPGTKHGAGYKYPTQVIMNAMHDYYRPLKEGKKVVLVVEPL